MVRVWDRVEGRAGVFVRIRVTVIVWIEVEGVGKGEHGVLLGENGDS